MERGEPSSDEDEDLQTLVSQHDTSFSPKPPHRSTFEIASAISAQVRRKFSAHKRYYLLALSLPLIFILVYFAFPLGRRISIVATQSPSNLMRESELRALYLLKNQQESLLALWNKTLADANLNGSGSVAFEELRSGVLDQIKMNRRIQKALLSSHRPKNASAAEVEAGDDNVGPDLANYGVDVCKKVEWPANRRTIEWKPKKNRFLFAICLSGQMSNHLICLEKHMFFAALLDRVLVFPSHKVDYKYDEVLDLDHINQCFGRKVAISYDEFVEMQKNKWKIDRLICYMANPPCFLDAEHIKRLKDLGISLGKIEAAWPEDAKSKEQKKRVVNDITPKFSSDDEVIAVGDLFYADVEEEWVTQPGGPLAHKCKTLIQPSRLIILTAQRFVQTFLGRNFIALHFRRHGFLKFWHMMDEITLDIRVQLNFIWAFLDALSNVFDSSNVKEHSCFFPVPQAAECILRVVERSNAPVIYLSTDAAESETDLLQSLLVPNDGKGIPLVKRPGHNSVEKWDALIYRNHLGGSTQVEAMLDKTICAMSSVFIGASGSTFTEDIFRIRRGWGASSQCDEYLCQGEQPNFIADNE